MLKTEEYLIETADRCIRLAREGRELIERLEAISNELMAKAVELDTKRDKNGKPCRRGTEALARQRGVLFQAKSPAVEPGFLFLRLGRGRLTPRRAAARRHWPAGSARRRRHIR